MSSRPRSPHRDQGGARRHLSALQAEAPDRAEIARERGLGPLAEAILAIAAVRPETLAAAYLSDEVPDIKAALEGARDILSEQFAENADLVGRLRSYMKERAFLRARVVDGKQEAGAKFSDYFDHVERWAKCRATARSRCCAGATRTCCRSTSRSMPTTPSPVKPVERMIAPPGDRPAPGGRPMPG